MTLKHILSDLPAITSPPPQLPAAEPEAQAEGGRRWWQVRKR